MVYGYKIMEYGGGTDVSGAAAFLQEKLPNFTISDMGSSIKIEFPDKSGYLTIIPSSDARYSGVQYTLVGSNGTSYTGKMGSSYMGNCYIEIAELNGNGIMFGQMLKDQAIFYSAVYVDSDTKELLHISDTVLTVDFNTANNEDVFSVSINSTPAFNIYNISDAAIQMINYYVSGTSEVAFLEGSYAVVVGMPITTSSQNGIVSNIEFNNKKYYLWYTKVGSNQSGGPFAFECTDKIA